MAMPVASSHPIVLLLRGINVGSRHRVAMADLLASLTEMGYADVRTHLQSGNVLLTAGVKSADAVARQVEAFLVKRYGFAIPVIARTAGDLAEVVAADPLREVATDPARYAVTFLNESPKQAVLRQLQKQDFGPEQFTVLGREVYQWCPGGQHESPMVKALAKAGVTTTGTARNWRTVTRLADLINPSG